MIRWTLIGVVALIAWWGNGFSEAMAQAQGPTAATVFSIGYGDTIRVLQGQQRITVRLACIDAPEMAQAPYGAQSRAYLQTRLRIGAPVTLLPQTVDRFGRTVAEVIGEVNLNLAMVEDGQAFAYRQYLSQCNARLLSQGHTYLERLNFTAFYEALLEANGDSLGEGGGNGKGKAGPSLSYVAKVQFNANLLVGMAYTGLLGLNPGDEFEIKLGKKQIRLVPVGASDDED